jgi:DNA-binding LytR/AlgR family response regulator
VINGIYIGMHYYSEWKESEHQRQEEKKVRAAGFTVKLGKQNLLVPFDEISGFYTEDGYTILLNSQNKKFFPDKSLDKIEKQLPEEWFFRLNRQYILHRRAITGFKRSTDGKVDVTIKGLENLPEVIQVSRTKAVAFKKWFQPEVES